MRIFIAGATGVLGTRLVPLLVQKGHEVTGMTRTPSKVELLQRLGAQPVVADAFDAGAVRRAVVEAAPDVVVHQLTSLSGLRSIRNFEKAFAVNARLRGEVTDTLLEASREAGASRFVAQSFGGYLFGGNGKRVLTEDDPLAAHPPRPFERVLAADRHLEAAVTGATWMEGIVLRYGLFYGPGTTVSVRPAGSQSEMVRKGMFPVIGEGTGISSFIHIDDAASATVAAIERGRRGIYHITDDDPAPASEWLPGLAAALGAKRPLRVPKWVGRLAGGPAAVIMMTEARGTSNEKARRELGWEPEYRSWREGFAHGLG